MVKSQVTGAWFDLVPVSRKRRIPLSDMVYASHRHPNPAGRHPRDSTSRDNHDRLADLFPLRWSPGCQSGDVQNFPRLHCFFFTGFPGFFFVVAVVYGDGYGREGVEKEILPVEIKEIKQEIRSCS